MTIASHIGQYRILRKIGAGGMGLVFLGEHTLLGRRAAIKTLLPTMSANREIVERFFNEARATSAISDPGVIQVFDFGYHVDGTAYIVMELLEGEALSARIDRLGKLPPGDALRIARQIAGSLAAAHACNIVHRDLKPENIFLVADAEAQGGERTKILDFGICKMGTGDPTLTQSGAMIGTPVYMSPEQCRGAGGVDHRSDIYAFGCLVFHMLTGRPPFVGEVSGELIVAHLEEEAPAPSLYVGGLPFAVDALLLRCLAKAPEDRYQSMAELQLVLADLAAGIDQSEPAVAAVPPSMPLGQGFRSLYDGNFAMAGGESSGTSRRPPWLRYVPTPRATSAPDDPEDSVVLPPQRGLVRAVLAGVLVVGVVIGLVTTSFVIYSGGRGAEANDRRAIALPAETAVRAPGPTRAVDVIGSRQDPDIRPTDNREDTAALVASGPPSAARDVAVTEAAASDHLDGVVVDAGDRARRAGASSARASHPTRPQRDAPRETATQAPPPPRPTAEVTPPAAARQPALPAVAPAVPVAPAPAPVAPAPAPVAPRPIAPTTATPLPPQQMTPPPPSSAPASTIRPNAASEDLYDTR